MNYDKREVEAVCYACLILTSEGLEITPSRVHSVVIASGMTGISQTWIYIYSNFFKRHKPMDVIMNSSLTRLMSNLPPPKKKEIIWWKEFGGPGLYVKYTNKRMIFKDLTAKLEIFDTHSILTTTQFFQNDTNDHYEVIYKFPTLFSECVYHVEAKIFDPKTGKTTLLRSQIFEKTRAIELYDDIISSGESAALIEKESHYVCSLNLGNFLPSMKCEITIKSVREVKVETSTRTTTILSIIPKMSCMTIHDSTSGSLKPVKYSRIDVISRLLLNQRPGETKIVDMKSTSHAKSFQLSGKKDEHSWTGYSEHVEIDSDYEVTVTLENYPDAIWYRHSLVEEEEEGEEEEEEEESEKQKKSSSTMELISFKLSDEEKYIDRISTPTTETTGEEKLYLEIIFIPDRSGSMSGGRMKKAIEAMKLCFKSLDIDQDIYFNVISFGSKHEHMFPKSRRLDEERYEEVMKSLNEMKANMGGTDIFTPLDKVLNEPKHEMCNRRVVFLMTDGEDGRRNDIVKSVMKYAGDTKIYTFGIGKQIDEHLIKLVAECSGGIPVFIRKNNEIHESVLKILNVVLEPEISNLEILVDDKKLEEDETNLLILKRFMRRGSRCLAFLKKEREGGKKNNNNMSIKYRIKEKCFKQELGQGRPIPRETDDLDNAWERMYVKKRVSGGADEKKKKKKKKMSGELVQLALEHSIVTQNTSFFMERFEYDVVERKIMGELVPRRVYTTQFRLEVKNPPSRLEDGNSEVEDYSSSDGNMGLSLFGGDTDSSDDSEEDQAMRRPVQARTRATTESSGLVDILLLVNVKGYWNVNDAVSEFIGISREEIEKENPLSSSELSFWVTLLMIEVLKKKYLDEKIKWKLIVEKATRNMKKEGVYDKLINLAVELISSKI